MYQKKFGNELVSINNQERLIELVGILKYDRYFKPLSELIEGFDDKRLPISDILLDEIEEKGIVGLMSTLKNF